MTLQKSVDTILPLAYLGSISGDLAIIWNSNDAMIYTLLQEQMQVLFCYGNEGHLFVTGWFCWHSAAYYNCRVGWPKNLGQKKQKNESIN